MAEEPPEPPRSRYIAGINASKRNELMHVLAHKMPEFSSLIRAGAPVSNENLDYYYKRVSGKRDSLSKNVDALWRNLSGPTEARIRYDLFLRDNPSFPDLFKNEYFIGSFTRTLNDDTDDRLVLGHYQSPRQYYSYARQTAGSEFLEHNPGLTRSSQEYLRIIGDYGSQYELKFFNSLLNALTTQLPADAVRRIDTATRGKYSRNLAAGGGGGSAAGGGGGYRGGARRRRTTRRRKSNVRKTRRNRRN